HAVRRGAEYIPLGWPRLHQDVVSQRRVPYAVVQGDPPVPTKGGEPPLRTVHTTRPPLLAARPRRIDGRGHGKPIHVGAAGRPSEYGPGEHVGSVRGQARRDAMGEQPPARAALPI